MATHAQTRLLDLSAAAIPDSRLVLTGPRSNNPYGTLEAPLSVKDVEWLFAEIPHLASIHHLDLSGNELTHVPDCVASMSALRFLDISANPLRALWPPTGPRLAMRGFAAAEAPAGVITSTSLRHLATTMPGLTSLDLSDAFVDEGILTTFLDLLCHSSWYSTLVNIDLRGNPLPSVPLGVLRDTAGPFHWRLFARGFQAGDQRPYYSAKVVLLGQGRTGKTHLLRRAFGAEHAGYYSPNSQATIGIETARADREFALQVFDPRSTPNVVEPFRKGRTVDLHSFTARSSCAIRVWDFGGQPLMHAAHRLFLSPERTVYVLVCDASLTRAANRLEYWLRLIRHEVSAECPVIVAITKSDLIDHVPIADRPFHAPTVEEVRMLGGRSAHSFVAIIDGLGWGPEHCEQNPQRQRRQHYDALKRFRFAWGDAVQSAPGLLVGYPSSWRRVAEWLEKEAFSPPGYARRKVVSLQSISDYCSSVDLPSEQHTSLVAAADAAGLLHYAITSNGGSLVVNPEWAQGPVYRLITNPPRSTSGVVAASQLREILGEHPGDAEGKALWQQLPFTEADQDTVLALMETKGLIFDINDPGPTRMYLVPDFLPFVPAAKPPVHGCVWRRTFDWFPEAQFGKLVGRLVRSAHGRHDGLGRHGVTVPGDGGPSVTVFLDPAESIPTQGTYAVLYVAVDLPTSKRPEAQDTLRRIDSHLAHICGADLLKQGDWSITYPSKYRRTQSKEAVSTHVRTATIAYQRLANLLAAADTPIRGWKELHAWACHYADPAHQAETDLSDHDRELFRFTQLLKPRTFEKYCREDGITPFWKTRGLPSRSLVKLEVRARKSKQRD